MEYIENNYYQNQEDGRCVRFISKNSAEEVYKYFDLEIKEEKSIRRKNPFMKLSITVLMKNKNDFFKEFLGNINKEYDSKLELDFKESNFEFKGSYLNEKLAIKVDDDIDDFFAKIQGILKRKLTTEQKDNFLSEQFFK